MKTRTFLTRAFTLVAFVGGGYLLYRNISRYGLDKLTDSISSIPLESGLLAFCFMAGSYLSLAGFDGSALYYLGKKLPPQKILLASFVSLSIGHNVGISILSSGAVRYRYYTRWGLTATQVGQLIIFCGFTVALGIATLAGALLMVADDKAAAFNIPGPLSYIGLAIVLLIFPVAYVMACVFLPYHLTIRNWSFRVPDWKLAVFQIAIGTLDFLMVAACLYFLLSGLADVRFIDVALGYAMANMLAILSHVPGGLGVLEAGLLYALPGDVPFGVLIAFRIVYFLIPLVLGLLLFLATEVWHLRENLKEQDEEDATGYVAGRGGEI